MPNVGNNNQSSGQQGYSANRTGTGKNTNNNDNVNSNKKSGEVYKARPEDTTKNQEQPSSSKKAAKTAAKAAGAYLGGPVGAKAVDALSKTKMGDKILNNAAKKVDRNPIMRRAVKKMDDKGAIDAADKAIDVVGANPSAASGNAAANSTKGASSDSSSGATGGGMGPNFLPGPFGRKKPNFLNNDEDSKDSNKGSSFNGIFSGSLSIKIAIIVFAPALLSLLLFSTVILAASGGTSTYDDAMGVSDSTGGNTGNIGYNASSPEAKAFYERVRDVKSEYQSNGKNIDVVYIAGVFYSLQSNASGIDYDSMSTAKIKEIADAMFKEESTTFDKDVFQDNLVNHVFLSYLPNSSVEKRKKMAKDALEYANNYKDLVKEWEKGSGDIYGSMANKLVQVAVSQLDESNPDKYNDTNNKYQRFMNIVGQHWCAAFVSWCANEAGIGEDIIPHSAAVDSFYEYYTSIGNFHTIGSGYIPNPGDLIIWKRGQNAKGWSHIGIVERYDAATGKLYTIEGNSSDSVARNIYSDLGGCTGFASPNYPILVSDFSGSNNAEKAWSFFRSKNVSKEATAAILGNLRQESGIDPTKLQYGGGPGRGIAQWEAGSSRYNMLVLYANRANQNWDSLEVQLEFLWYELSGGETTTRFIMNRDYGGFNNFIQSNNIEWAVEAFEKSFERAGKPNMENRKTYAREFYQQYGGK